MAFSGTVDDDARKESDNFAAPSSTSPYSKGEPYSTDICIYTLSETGKSVTPDAGINQVTVTALGLLCSWTAVSNVPWITITSGQSGTSSGTVSYSYTENMAALLRTGTITIADKTYTVSQAGRPLTADGYETNNTVAEAYSFTPTFTQNASIINISSASCHNSTDVDYYKINLETGYSYTVSAVLYDLYNKINNSNYTLDAKISYSTNNGTTWSTAYPTQFSGAAMTGGIFYLKIEPSPAGSMGSYAAKIDITASCNSSLPVTSQRVTFEAGTNQLTVTTGSSCTWTAVSNVSWITLTSGQSGTGSGIVTYSYTENIPMYTRTGTITVAGRTYTVTQTTQPLLPDGYETNNTVAEAYSFTPAFVQNVSTITISPASCHNADDVDYYKINLTSGSYTVSAVLYDWENPNGGDYTLDVKMFYSTNNGFTWSAPVDSQLPSLAVQGPLYLKIQAYNQWNVGSYAASINITSFTLSATSKQLTSAAGTNQVDVTTSSSSSWTAASNVSWITLTSGQSGTGSGSVAYSYTANTGLSSRTGTITVAGQTYTVTQDPVPCSFTLVLNSANATSAIGTGSINVTASRSNCPWTASSDAAWLTLTSGQSGTGSGTAGYSYTKNTGLSSRTGTITIAGQTYTVTQEPAPCSFTIASNSTNITSGSGTGNVAVTASRSNCSWTAASNAAWITLTSDQSTTGSGSVDYSYTENTGLSSRTGTITIANHTYTVMQEPAPCSFTLTSSSTNVTSALGTGNVAVTASRSNCSWTASSDAAWLTLTSAPSGTGSGSVDYSYTENTGLLLRIGTITIGDQTYTVIQEPVPCSFTLTSSSTNVTSALGTGNLPFTASRSNCSWTASSDAAWLTLTSAPSGTGSGSVDYSYTENTELSSRIGIITIGDQTYTVTQDPVPCSFTLTSSSANAASAIGTGSVSFTANRSNCSWTATSNVSWLTLTSDISGTGSGSVDYSYTENTGLLLRTGTITIGDQTYTVTQDPVPCSFTLTSSSANAASTLGTGSIPFTASRSNCSWTASSNATWLTLTSAPSGSGSGSVDYSYTANTGLLLRTGTITIGDQTYTVTQDPVPCSFTLPSSFANAASTLGTGSVSFTASRSNCSWTATSNATWLTLTSAPSGSGSGSVDYSYTENTGLLLRTGTITIGDQTYTVTQDPVPCSFTLTSSSANATSTLGTGSIPFTASRSNCSWTATSNATWLTLTSAQSGSGSGSVDYSYTENTGLLLRIGTITIGDQTYTVIQEPVPCSFTLTSSSANVTSALGTGNLPFTASRSNCSWTASSDAAWLTLTSAQSGTGSGSVDYSYTANASRTSREGIITIAGQAYTVTQEAAPCTYSLTKYSAEVTGEASTGTLGVTTQSLCRWIAASNVSWITVTPASGEGSGEVTYSIAKNTGAERTGRITIAGQTFTLTQAAIPCSYSLPTSSTTVPSTTGTSGVNVTANRSTCPWTASSNVAWITLISGQSGTGSGSVSYSYTANASRTSREGIITIAGQSYTVTQEAAPCTYSLTKSSVEVTGEASTGTLGVTTQSLCRWIAASNVSWITVTPASGEGSGEVTYSIAKNTGVERTGTITIAGQTFTVKQTMVTGFETISHVQIFPNPAREYVTLDLSLTNKNYASLKIANVFGQVFYERENPQHKMQIPLKGFSSGLYFIILQGGEKAVVQKLIVE